jgi:hypothetical protein
MREWYETQRKQRWSPFLAIAIKNLGERLAPPEEAEVDSANAVVEATADVGAAAENVVRWAWIGTPIQAHPH